MTRSLRTLFSMCLLFASFFGVTLSSHSQPLAEIEFNGSTLEDNNLLFLAPGHFTPGQIKFGLIPEGNGTDGKGLRIDLSPGQGALLLSTVPIEATGLVRISGSYRATNRDLTLALVALNSPVDGQLGYTNFTGQEVPLGMYREISFLYEAPSGQMQLAIQAVLNPYSSLSGTVYVDHLTVEEVASGEPAQTIPLHVSGGFDQGLSDLIQNLNGVDGAASPLFQSFSDIALRLSIQPQNLAANVATYAEDSVFPATWLSEVNVARDTSSDGGVMALVMTNGYQNVALFRNVMELPTVESEETETLKIGGNFLLANPDLPVYVVVQDGGPGVTSSVIVDDLSISSRIPPSLKEITVSLPNLPEEAKPLDMVLIPAGTFVMGSPVNEYGRDPDEGPQHTVTLTKPFYMGKYEVTQAQWFAVMGYDPTDREHGHGSNYPIYSVSPDECQQFINQLNQMGIGKFRLPTEAEWEYACRAGTTTRYYFGDDPDGTELTKYEWYQNNQHILWSKPVGQKSPNPWGLYDMLGNEKEWCQDFYSAYSDQPQTNPVNLNGYYRISRGGDSGAEDWKCRSAIRPYQQPDYRYYLVGLRLVREVN